MLQTEALESRDATLNKEPAGRQEAVTLLQFEFGRGMFNTEPENVCSHVWVMDHYAQP